MTRFNAAGLAILAGGALGLTGSTLAQNRLPDPPAPVVRAGQTERIDNYDQWVAAYQRSGRPRMLVYTDVVTRNATPAGGDVGNLARLAPRVEEYFRAPDVILINPGAQAILTAQQVEEMRRNDEYSAAKMVGESVKADVVLFVRLVEQQGRRDGSTYVGTYTLADLRQGTTLGRHSWEMTPDPADEGEYTARRMGDYARAIARRVVQQYTEAYPAAAGENVLVAVPASAAPAETTMVTTAPAASVPATTVVVTQPAPATTIVVQQPASALRRFTIRLVGEYEDDTLLAFREALRAIPGIRRDSILFRGEDKSSTQSVATFELAYAGELIDLRSQVRSAAVSQLGMEAALLGSREGSMELKLAPLSLSPRERALSGGAETARNADERATLAYRYDKVGRPTIAVVMNQAIVEDEAALPVDEPVAPGGNALQQGEGVNIIIGDRVGIAGDGSAILDTFSQRVVERELRDVRKERRQDTVIDTMFFENKIVERLVQLGLRPKDVSGAQADMAGEFSGRQWKDRELAFALGKKSGADVVMSGVGRLVRDKATQKPMRLIFTIRAYGVSDSTIVGASSVSRDVSGSEQAYNQLLEQMSAEAVGKVVAQMSDVWASAARAQTPKP